MKVLLTLLLAVCWLQLSAQQPSALSVHTNTKAQIRLTYPETWQRHRSEDRTEVTWYASTRRPAPAVVTLTIKPLPAGLQDEANLLTAGQPDSLWRRIRRLPRAQVLHLDQHDAGSHQEVRYAYTFAPAPGPTRTRVEGRRLWRGGYEYRLEYRATTDQDGRYLTPGRQLLASFTFTGTPPSRRYDEQRCDDKMYGIAALRFRNERWEDDCRTIHEFNVSAPAEPPRIHRQVLPFQSYALAKGFDNCLYSVTKAPTDTLERIYRYDPSTRQGRYTSWQLPPQGPENVWISAATDEYGDLYFMTSDAGQLVKVSPRDGQVTVLWTTDPMQKAPYYPAIGLDGTGSHGNFCLDDAHTLYQVYSTDGSILSVNLNTRQPGPERVQLSGLPKRGGYSDLLFQNDASGRRRLYLAGPKALYEVDMARREAHYVRRGVYTDLAGCNLFRVAAPVAAAPAAPVPTTATWRGRVLDAVTFQPLPQAQLQLQAGGTPTTVPLAADGSFTFAAEPGRSYAAHVQLAGYLAADSAFTTRTGPYVQDILLFPLAVGTTLPLENVQFTQGKADLLPSSFPALDQLISLLTRNPTLTIELRGHTDNQGDPQKNVVLSQERVAAVKTYLVERGIGAPRITGSGLGGAEPRASNAREATRKLNRRVEVRVTSVH
ncbi:OmpA family protein [Hymenobacter sp. BT635]|uniref:OmpA family protein n=1 Tax=Hymenobacter nitidus TaxID=2880929 RepID=A0ABS8A9G2_9BACT|nr:OmpA family protein [Hymenobacter nitidus]MCB2377033.1 OmpA family protein [Hymenobacter nitidus]